MRLVSGNRTRSGFSLLELMIALGLLGALLAVAWSLLDTFRNAEMKGWKLSHRTQTVRSARDWLENDMQHLVQVAAQSGSPGAMSSSPIVPRLIGDRTGFSATIAPSMDPIPFLENLMSDTQPSESEPTLNSSSFLDPNSTADDMPKSPWPSDSLEIEYRLTPVNSSSISSLLQSTDSDEQTQYVLTRTEMRDGRTSSMGVAPSERVLTTQDLYRQSDDSTLSMSIPARESKLEGLMKPEFRYHDGTSWKKEWNSTQQGLPIAIAFGFDFPVNSEIQKPVEPKKTRDEEDLFEVEQFPNTLPTAALSSEPELELTTDGGQGLMESTKNEIQIVVYVRQGANKSKDATSRMEP